MYNHSAGTRGCVCARCPHARFMCEGNVWGSGGLRTATCPCVTHRNSRPPGSGRPLCLLYVYERKVPLDKDGESAFIIPGVTASFDKDDPVQRYAWCPEV